MQINILKNNQKLLIGEKAYTMIEKHKIQKLLKI